jgi:hypothetical protein
MTYGPFIDTLKEALKKEKSEIGKNVIEQIIENDDIAKKERAPMCQDTGLVVCFVEIGYDVHLNGDLYDAINEGVRQAYQDGLLEILLPSIPLQVAILVIIHQRLSMSKWFKVIKLKSHLLQKVAAAKI